MELLDAGTVEQVAQGVSRWSEKELMSTLQADAARLFPNISLAIGEGRVAALARLSTLVGMVCPGLHSIFGSLDISFDGPQTETVDFIVTDVDDHFRLISQSVAGSGIRGNIKAFARVPPVKQLSMAAVAGSVKRGEFAGSVALVAGGSRGLGALVARIVAAGGGRVIITYAVGLEEARTVQADICDAGARCELLQYDALSPNVMELIAELPAITHFYYFASPKISAKRSIDPFAPDLFNRFISFYVTGFQRLCCAISKPAGATLKVLYPSTIFLDDRPPDMTEYCMAKAAGEVLCDDLVRFTPNLLIARPRLPRMATDQTTSIIPVRTQSAIEVMLPIVRSLHRTLT